MKSISSRIFSIASLVVLTFGLTFAAAGQATSASQPSIEKLTKHQLITLISTAKTPAEHERLAQYYKAKSQDYLEQAKEHEAMVAAYKANPSLVTDKTRESTVNHCEYFVKTFKELGAKAQELSDSHELMAKDAVPK